MVLNDGGSAKRSRRFYLKIILFGGTKTMKKVLCTVLAVVMAVVCFAGCSAPAAEGGNHDDAAENPALLIIADQFSDQHDHDDGSSQVIQDC